MAWERRKGGPATGYYYASLRIAGRGLVRAARGSGTFVEGGRLAYPISRRTRFSEIVGTAGREAGGCLVASRLEPASDRRMVHEAAADERRIADFGDEQ